MIEPKEQKVFGSFLAFSGLLATLVIAPWTSYDPINLPKLLIIAIGGSACLALAFIQWKALLRPRFRVYSFVTALFMIDLCLVLAFAGNNFTQEFYGTQGRATGFVAYFALVGLLIAGILSGTKANLNRISHALILTGFISVIYGVIQAVGADPVKWGNTYSPVIGFLGNPDFQSSFVALSAVMVFSLWLEKYRAPLVRGLLLVYQPLALYVIKETKAQQGFLVFFGGISILILVYISKSKLSSLTKPLIAIGVIGAGFVVSGSLNKGPLAGLLHKESVIYRGDYWRAGWNMTINHPFFGVGLDSYGDWYRRSRTLEATLRRGPDIASNSAHNVLLDLSSNGGFPLLIIYVVLMVLVIRSAIRVLRRTTSFDGTFSGILAVWAGYQAQSVISLNQLGLAVWGWMLSGLIIGWDLHQSDQGLAVNGLSEKKKKVTRIDTSHQNLAPSSVIAIFVGIVFGLLMAIPPFATDVNYKRGLESGKIEVLIDSAYQTPIEVTRMARTAVILSNNNLSKEAIAMISEASRQFPDSYEVWAIMVQIPGIAAEQLIQAKAQMKRLDPLNPNLK